MGVLHEYVPMRGKRDNMCGYSEEQIKRRLQRQGWTVWRGELISLTRHLQHSRRVDGERRLGVYPGDVPSGVGTSTQMPREARGKRSFPGAGTHQVSSSSGTASAALSGRKLIRLALEGREPQSVLDFPNVERKYRKLLELLQRDFPEHIETLQYLCHVHHGIPDYLCYRGKGGVQEWKFVECKLIYEQLLPGQKACIPKLQAMGFIVEVQRLVDHRTKTRRAEVDVRTGEKRVTERQMKLPRRTKAWSYSSGRKRKTCSS